MNWIEKSKVFTFPMALCQKFPQCLTSFTLYSFVFIFWYETVAYLLNFSAFLLFYFDVFLRIIALGFLFLPNWGRVFEKVLFVWNWVLKKIWFVLDLFFEDDVGGLVKKELPLFCSRITNKGIWGLVLELHIGIWWHFFIWGLFR